MGGREEGFLEEARSDCHLGLKSKRLSLRRSGGKGRGNPFRSKKRQGQWRRRNEEYASFAVWPKRNPQSRWQGRAGEAREDGVRAPRKLCGGGGHEHVPRQEPWGFSGDHVGGFGVLVNPCVKSHQFLLGFRPVLPHLRLTTTLPMGAGSPLCRCGAGGGTRSDLPVSHGRALTAGTGTWVSRRHPGATSQCHSRPQKRS